MLYITLHTYYFSLNSYRSYKDEWIVSERSCMGHAASHEQLHSRHICGNITDVFVYQVEHYIFYEGGN